MSKKNNGRSFMEAIEKIREGLPPDAFKDAFCKRCGRLETRCDGHEVEDLRACLAAADELADALDNGSVLWPTVTKYRAARAKVKP